MSIQKIVRAEMNNKDTKLALLEQSFIHINASLSEIKIELSQVNSFINIKFNELEKEIKEENGKVWKKLELLDQRINDNFKHNMSVMITLFSGLYATALGGMLLRLCKWI
jgi:Na+/phosphate symporter